MAIADEKANEGESVIDEGFEATAPPRKIPRRQSDAEHHQAISHKLNKEVEEDLGEVTAPLVVSLIVPVHNASVYLKETFASIASQTYRPLEVVLFDDASTDDSLAQCIEWAKAQTEIVVVVAGSKKNGGPGFARNRAVRASTGVLLCHFDADDLMLPNRVAKQVALYLDASEAERPFLLIGSNFDRYPSDSTPYYQHWINGLSDEELLLQRFRECTVICPSWLYSRALFDRIAAERSSNKMSCIASNCSSNSSSDSWVGAFVESSQAILETLNLARVPEDLYFFLDHLELGGRLAKCREELLTYRFTPGSWALGSKKQDLARVRASYFEKMIMNNETWSKGFTCWGYGKDGRKFVSSYLSAECASKLDCFVDVDEKKIGMQYYIKSCKKHVLVKHFSEAVAPMIICVGSKHTQGALEQNIQTLNLREGIDYYHFS